MQKEETEGFDTKQKDVRQMYITSMSIFLHFSHTEEYSEFKGEAVHPITYLDC